MITLLLLACLAHVSAAESPGYRLRATKAGLDYATSLGGQEVTKLIHAISIPPMSFKDGDLTVNLKGISIPTFQASAWSYALHPPSQLSYAMNGASIEAEGDFDGSVKVSIFPAIGVSGHIDAKASGVSMSVTAQFGRDNQGRPTIKAVGCSCDLGSFTLTLSGNIVAEFLNLFHSLIEGAVKPQIQQAICQEGETAINTNLAQLLAQQPTSIDVGAGFSIDYTLTQSPAVTSDYVELQGSGDILYKGQPAQGVATPVIDASGAESDRMLNFWGSDYILNGLNYQAYHAGLLSIDINKDAVPEAKKYLATTCSGLCIGTVVKAIGQQYPNTYASATVTATKSPLVKTNSENVTLQAEGIIDLGVEVNSKVTSVATASIGLAGNVIPSVQNGKIYGKVDITGLQLAQTGSTLNGTIPWTFLGKLGQNILQNEINGLLKAGIPLPVIPQLSILRPAVSLHERTVQIVSDVNYSL